MTHAITEDELTNYVEEKRQEWTQFACSSGAGSIKRLDFFIGHVAPVYRVTLQGKDIYIGVLKETAVREYNALP
jgi:hypothetical protein